MLLESSAITTTHSDEKAKSEMAWHSAGTTHFWCTKCKKQVPAESELVFKEGKVLWKWKCTSCGTDYLTES